MKVVLYFNLYLFENLKLEST